MINILIEVDDNKNIVHDFCWFALHSINYNHWYKNSEIFNVKYSTINEIDFKLKDYIPIGSIEFVHKYMDIFDIKIPNAINIPDELNKFDYLKRTINYCYKDNIEKFPIFIKPATEIKLFTGGVISEKYYLDLLFPEIQKDTKLITSDVIEIITEYRCFVYNKKLLSINRYSGDCTIFPNVDIINSMIKDYKNSPTVYTLDVGITDKNETVLIECHNFYSVGLYGFNDGDMLIYMFINAFNEIKTK